MAGTPTCPICKKGDKVRSIDKNGRHYKCDRCGTPIVKAGPR